MKGLIPKDEPSSFKPVCPRVKKKLMPELENKKIT